MMFKFTPENNPGMWILRIGLGIFNIFSSAPRVWIEILAVIGIVILTLFWFFWM